jgi:uncharacterized OsmC-like protein
MELIVNYLGAVQFEVDARGHKVICDQPVDNGGFDEGMTPPDFLLASLGTCAGYYAVQYLKTRNLPMEGLQVRVTAEKVKPPARMDNFRIEVKLPESVEEQHIDGVTRSVHKCLIHNTLLNPPKIEIAIEAPVRP